MDVQFGGWDCEDMRDFVQYYRGRYFGYAEPGDAVIRPAVYNQIAGGDLTIYLWDPATELVRTELQSQISLIKWGKFGHPILGNVNYGPTYTYLSATPLRESSKGLRVDSLKFNWPNHGRIGDGSPDIIDLYSVKTPAFGSIYNGTAGHRSVEQFKLMVEVYNRKYFTIPEAIKQLESGARIGCAVSHKLGLYTSAVGDKIQISYRGERVGELEKNAYGHLIISSGNATFPIIGTWLILNL